MNKKYFVELISVIAVLLSVFIAMPVVAADNSAGKPEKPIVTPQCWFICPPDKSADE